MGLRPDRLPASGQRIARRPFHRRVTIGGYYRRGAGSSQRVVQHGTGLGAAQQRRQALPCSWGGSPFRGTSFSCRTRAQVRGPSPGPIGTRQGPKLSARIGGAKELIACCVRRLLQRFPDVADRIRLVDEALRKRLPRLGLQDGIVDEPGMPGPWSRNSSFQ